MKENFMESVTKQWPVVTGIVVFALVIIFFRSPWLRAKKDLMSMQEFTSSWGGFSVKIPKNWGHTPPSGETYLSIRDNVYSSSRYQSTRTTMYAEMFVEATPSRGVTPSATEFGEEFNAQLSAGREKRAQFEKQLGTIPWTALDPIDTQFEIVWIGGYEWAKATIVFRDKVSIIWQIANSSNRYRVLFSTNNMSHYEPIFEKIMGSFSLID